MLNLWKSIYYFRGSDTAYESAHEGKAIQVFRVQQKFHSVRLFAYNDRLTAFDPGQPG